jgi:hypothetical protein
MEEKCSGIESNWGYAEYAFSVLAISNAQVAYVLFLPYHFENRLKPACCSYGKKYNLNKWSYF